MFGGVTDWPRKIRRADRTAKVRALPVLTADFTTQNRRGAARVRYLREDAQGAIFAVEVRHIGIPPTLRIVPETPSSLRWQRFGRPDFQTGDAEFDALANLSGTPAWISAAMTNKTRNQVSTVLRKGGRIENGSIFVELKVRRPHPLVTQVHDLLRLGQRLSLPDSEVVRMLVSRALGTGRADVRKTLVKQVIDLAPLIERFGTIARLERHLRGSNEELADALRLAWLTGEPARIAAFPEPVVLDLLDAPRPVRMAAIERLGDIGTVAAIAPLTAASRGFFTSSSIKRAAQAALALVMHRVGPIEAGGLALTAEDGRISLADD